MKDYYGILGVRIGASAAEIKRAYRLLAVKYHPDKNPSQEATTRFTEIAEAYDVLSDPDKKFVYDHQSYKLVHELAQEEPVPEYRDPRYRRQKTAPRKREKSADYQLMEKWNRYANWINLCRDDTGDCFCQADLFLPTITTRGKRYGSMDHHRAPRCFPL